MKLIKGCLVIVLVLCAIIVFADGKRKKGKVLEKPYTGEARLKPGEPSVDFCFFLQTSNASSVLCQFVFYYKIPFCASLNMSAPCKVPSRQVNFLNTRPGYLTASIRFPPARTEAPLTYEGLVL